MGRHRNNSNRNHGGKKEAILGLSLRQHYVTPNYQVLKKQYSLSHFVGANGPAKYAKDTI